jgi:hypothetical protein
MSHGMDASRLVAYCNQDASKDGILPVATDNHHCSHYADGEHVMVPAGGGMRCTGCGFQPDLRAVQSYNGATKAEMEALKQQARNPAFGRRRWGQRWGI